VDWQDDEFEAFLRQFRPRQPAALPNRHWRTGVLAVAATILIVAILPLRSMWRSPGATQVDGAGTEARANTAAPRGSTVNGMPRVEVALAGYAPEKGSGQRVNVSLPGRPPRKALRSVTPPYPPEAQRVGLEGAVELKLTVNPAGDVTDTERVSSRVDLRPDQARASERAEYYAENPYAFATAAQRAAKEWTFEPANSTMTVVVSFGFTLTGGEHIGPPPVSPTLSSVRGPVRPGPPPLGATANPAPGAAVQRVKVGGAIKAPRRLVNVDPTYPEEARAARIQGVVILQIVIGEDGSVIDARVVRSIPALDQAAIDAVLLWQYEQTLLNDQPVEVELLATCNFTLD
jgi:TonB family protein